MVNKSGWSAAALVAVLFSAVPSFAASTAIRSLAPTSYSPGSPITVTLAVTPDPAVLAYALEETPPTGWTITGINNSGTLTGGKIKWGVYFDATVRSFTYTATPPAGETGTKNFAGIVSFDGGSITMGGATSISPVPNTLPTISNIADQSTNEDTVLPAVAFTVGDTETPVANLTLTGASNNTALVPVANIVFGGSGASRTIAITPVANQNGTATITVTVRDASGGTATDTFVLTVAAVNDTPTANAQSQTTAEDTAKIITLTGTDVEGTALTYAIAVNPSNGTLTGTGASRTYTPNANFNGSDSFTFTVNDGSLTSLPATVSLTVTAANDAPTISDILSQSTPISTPLSGVAFTVGDAETAAASLTVSGTSANTALVTNAGIVFGGSGASRTVTVTPVANQSGTAVITITVTDANGLTAQDTFTLTVNASIPPTISDITNQSTNEDTATGALAFTVGDAETPVANLTVTGASNNTTLVPVSGIVFGGSGASRTVNIVPAANQFGSATITVTVRDANGGTASDSFVVTVISVNDAPNMPILASWSTNEDTPQVDLLIISDVDTPLANIVMSGSSSNQALIPNANIVFTVVGGNQANRRMTITPLPNQTGFSDITYTANDQQGGTMSHTWRLTVNPVNDAPVAIPQTLTTQEDTAKAIVLAGTDIEGNPLTYAISQNPLKGTLSGTAPNLTYTPTANINGDDSFTFTVNDGAATSAPATILIGVGPVNDVPIANSQTVSTNRNIAKAITLTGTDVDVNTLTYAIVTNPTNGTLSGTGANRTYTPNNNYTGVDSFTFKVNDGTVDSANATVTINVTMNNNTPVASAQSVTTNEDTVKSIVLSGTDADADPLTYTVLTPLPSKGVLSGTAPNLTYTPNLNANGSDTFTFKVNDGFGDSNTATVTLTITPVNDAPTVSGQTLTTNEDTAISPLTLSGSDVDGNTLTYTIVTPPTNGVLSGSGASRTYTPTANANGSDSFVFRVNDGTVNSANATVSITINAVNDVPVANSQTVATFVNVAKAITLTGSDVEGNVTYIIVSGPSHGTLSGSGANQIYTPANNYVGPDSFSFITNDGTADSAAATITINVATTNLAPTADAGSDQTVSFPTTVALNGTVSDDGLPNGNLTVLWTKVSGPGTVTFGNAAFLDTTAIFSAPGSYTLRLTASDGSLSKTDDVNITLNSSGTNPPSQQGGTGETDFLTFTNVFNPSKETLTVKYVISSENMGSSSVKSSMLYGPGGKSAASLIVYDRLGNKIKELEGTTGQATWDGRNSKGELVSSGTYLVVLKADKIVKRKVVVIK